MFDNPLADQSLALTAETQTPRTRMNSQMFYSTTLSCTVPLADNGPLAPDANKRSSGLCPAQTWAYGAALRHMNPYPLARYQVSSELLSFNTHRRRKG